MLCYCLVLYELLQRNVPAEVRRTILTLLDNQWLKQTALTYPNKEKFSKWAGSHSMPESM